jgi:hypothetical protein
MTKYKIMYGLKIYRKQNEFTLYSVVETLNKRGILGYILNYGNLVFFTTSRRKYSFDKIHGARYIYEIIQELQHGESRGLDQNAAIISILRDGKKDPEQVAKEKQAEMGDVVDFTDLSSLGFTEAELKEFGLAPKRKLPEESYEKDSTEEAAVENDNAPVEENSSERRRARSAGRRR